VNKEEFELIEIIEENKFENERRINK